MSRKTFYVTTPIYYVTAKPHLGSLYSTLIADVLSRWNALKGAETFFLTGTDEHGQKIEQAAQKAGKNPQVFIDEFIPAYKDTWKLYNIAYDSFIRTTDGAHVRGAQQFIKTLLDRGDIYKSSYIGWYCTPCETFVTEKESSSSDAVLCPSCVRKTEKLQEETYFFALSKYQDKLLRFYSDNPDFITPKERLNEVIRFVESGLHDLSISRTTVKWGVPFPNDEDHTIYVWAEALTNYITAIGYGNADKKDVFIKWWPANVHVIGKDIVRFHAVYWPAFLMAAGLELPQQLLVHGWITVDNEKMSKSLGNVVDPVALAQAYGADEVRYYLMKRIPVNQDGNFSTGDLEEVVSTTLANDLGNLFNRMVTLAHKNNTMSLHAPETWEHASRDIHKKAQAALETFVHYMDVKLFHRALSELWTFISEVNAYFHAQEPWKLAKQNKVQFDEVLYVTAFSLYIIAYALLSFMPRKMNVLLDGLGVGDGKKILNDAGLDKWNTTFSLKQLPVLFKKYDQQSKKVNKPMEQKTQNESIKKDEFITIDDFAKVEQVVGTITACKEVEDSEKLLCLTVDCGDKGIRHILSGIKKWYACEDLVGKQGVFVVNLKPRKMAGLESQGMMLFAKDKEGTLQMIMPANKVANGERIS